MKGRVDECMAWGALSGMTGLFLYADALGGGRAYGYTSGSVIEFVFGTLFVVAGTLLLHIAGVYRDRQFRADEERRRRARDERWRVRESNMARGEGAIGTTAGWEARVDRYADSRELTDEEREILKKVEDYRAGRLETYGLDEVKQHLGLDD